MNGRILPRQVRVPRSGSSILLQLETTAGERFTSRKRNSRIALQSKPGTGEETLMRDFRLPRALMGDIQAPILLAAGSRLEALRLLPLLRALRTPGRGPGALLIDTGEAGAAVCDALREHGLAADLRLPAASSTTGMALALARLCVRLRPALMVAGGASSSGLAVALGARGAGVSSALLVSSIDPAPRWRWRLLSALHTWFYLARERPKLSLPRGRAIDVGDPLFDLCREQSEALGIVAEQATPRALLLWTQLPPDAQGQVDNWLGADRQLRLDWAHAPAAGNAGTQDNLRRMGALPHWRVLGLLRRAQVVLTDSELIAAEARWLGRAVVWLGGAPTPAGALAGHSPAHDLKLALAGGPTPRPQIEDGRAAMRLAAHLLDSVEQRAFAGLLTRVHR